MDARLTAYLTRLEELDRRRVMVPEAGVAATPGPFALQLRSAGLAWRFVAVMGAHLLESLLLFASWAAIGSGVLSGRLDEAMLWTWTLCLISTVPLRLVSKWWSGVIAVGIGGLLKEWLLSGAMALDADFVRRKGVGGLIAEVLETDVVERLGVSGGLDVTFAALELLVVLVVLAYGAAARWQVALLVGWTALASIVLAANIRRRASWTAVRLDLTHRLIERMIAHRTRATQQTPAEWHRDEDVHLAGYSTASTALDTTTALFEAALPRGYVIVAFALLIPSFLSNDTTIAQRAIALAAILFAGDSLQRLMVGLPRTVVAWMAWQKVKPIVDAASAPAAEGVARDLTPASQTGIQISDIGFTHQGRLTSSVTACSLVIAPDDTVLLEGSSGSGKSTLATLIAGLRSPTSGTILAGGFDLATLGAARWRRRVALVPQYHENHIFSASLGFNLLLGRPYPHSARDLEEARKLCDRLGLGQLVDSMPAGLDQMIGETGWQLSHGERSRVFLARALLQRSGVTVLDESLAALDPGTLRQCLECLFALPGAVMVIAHP